MKRWQNVILQTILAAGQIVNAAEEDKLIPKEYSPYIAIGMGMAQMWISKKAHEVNPDGTPAKVAYEPNQGTKL